MVKRIELPEELDHLLEKRELDDRREKEKPAGPATDVTADRQSDEDRRIAPRREQDKHSGPE